MRIVIINYFSMKRIALLLCVVVLSLFFSVGEVFAEDIGNNIETYSENNIETYSENNIETYSENNIETYSENNTENNTETYSENNTENNTETYSENNIDNNLKNNTSQEIDLITKDKNNSNKKTKPSIKDIFGDDQTFPFVAGFGKD